jgi:hypothetical protein
MSSLTTSQTPAAHLLRSPKPKLYLCLRNHTLHPQHLLGIPEPKLRPCYDTCYAVRNTVSIVTHITWPRKYTTRDRKCYLRPMPFVNILSQVFGRSLSASICPSVLCSFLPDAFFCFFLSMGTHFVSRTKIYTRRFLFYFVGQSIFTSFS